MGSSDKTERRRHVIEVFSFALFVSLESVRKRENNAIQADCDGIVCADYGGVGVFRKSVDAAG